MKTMKHPAFTLPNACQAGAVLVTGLMFLAVLTLLGVTSARMSSLEERMSGNMRDRSLAMQAAELALRDAEKDIGNLGCSQSQLPSRCLGAAGLAGFYATCNQDGVSGTTDDGLCMREGATLPTYTLTSITWPAFVNINGNFGPLTVDMTAAPNGTFVVYGTFTTTSISNTATSATVLDKLSAPPRYIIEGLLKKTVPYYRITVRAQGGNPNTVVWLQEVFRPVP